MIFAETPAAEAEGAILAHSARAGSKRLKKGRILTRADIALLIDHGVDTVIAARLEAEDVHEDAAATRVHAHDVRRPRIAARARGSFPPSIDAARTAAAARDAIRHRMMQGYPLNLSISLSGGEETNQDAPSNGE